MWCGHSDDTSLPSLCAKASLRGYLAALKWVVDQVFPPGTAPKASLRGDLNILATLKETIGVDGRRISILAATAGHLSILKWVRQELGIPLDSEEICNRAARRKHTDVLQWALTEGCPVKRIRVVEEGEGADLDCSLSPATRVDTFMERYPRLPKEDADLVLAALQWKDSDVMKWAMELKCPCEAAGHAFGITSPNRIEWVVRSGSLNSRNGGDERTAVEHYQLAAAQGDADAQFILGACY